MLRVKHLSGKCEDLNLIILKLMFEREIERRRERERQRQRETERGTERQMSVIPVSQCWRQREGPGNLLGQCTHLY